LQHADAAESAATHEDEWEKYARLSCSRSHPVPQEVLELTKDAEVATGHLNLYNVSGPAVRSICFALPLILMFVTFFPFVVWRSSTCPQKGKVYGDHPAWVPLLYVPVFILVTVMEWKSLRYVLLPYVQWLQPFKIGFCAVSLQSWLVFHVFTSSTAKLDMFTSSLFVAKVFKGFTCDKLFWKGAQQAWAHVIGESIVAQLPFMSHLVGVCFVGWAMILLQLVLAFLESYPSKGPHTIDYELKSKGKIEEGYATLWTDLWNCVPGEEKVWNADILRVLASATRTLSIVELSCQWQMARVCKHLQTCESDSDKQRRCFEMLRKQSRSCGFRLWLINILEKAVILETQVTMYALHRAMGHGHGYLAVSSICISLMTLLHTLVVAFQQLKSLEDTYEKAVSQLKGLTQHQQDQEDGGVDENLETFSGQCEERWTGLAPEGSLRGKVLSAARASKMSIVLQMRLGIFVLIVILLHTIVKFIMAARGCEQGFWNIPKDFSSLRAYGCVDMSGIFDTINYAQ